MYSHCILDLTVILKNSAFYLATLLGFALAQSMEILAPPAGTTLTPGNNFTVQLQMSNFPENIDVVAVVIGLQHCLGTQCDPPTEVMGSILYQGPFTPPVGQLTTNYSVAVPSSFSSGTAQLGVINFFMVGAGYMPVVQYLNETVTVC
ncbi:hypothetical protein BKA82DRAFT_4085049 [Pisolithus tinctorius]|nr:hypothetical protein BKA82DRAFT_4085049 [Pisolithus tinctorius]